MSCLCLDLKVEPPVNNVEPDNEDAEWDEDEDDDDIDAEAEKMAQRLRAELLADIHRVNAAAAAAPAVIPQPVPSAGSKKEQDLIATMKNILTFLDSDTLARTTLESSIIPNMGGASVFNVITSSVSSGRVPKEIAMPLHQSVVALARTDSLFGNLRLSNASSIQLDKGKRKRDHDENVMSSPKRTYAQHYDLNAQLMEAVGAVSRALAASSGHPLEPALISPIQLHLHQIFLFAVTSSPRAGLGMNALQEIGGLIQVIGVLTGIQIGQSLPQSSSIATAVYPCLISGCQKTFSRLYTLRNHQRVHAVERPYRCTSCPASFVRNHDLKRHVKLHDKKAWKCSGCDKIFSRKDAIRRHKKVSQNHGAKGQACVHGEIIEVENDDDGDMMREEKRAKMWNGIAVSVATGGISDIEEGEIQPSMLSALQTTVLTLHPLLQTRVSNALVTSTGPVPAPPTDAAKGQSALASVIARAQIHNKPDAAPTTSEAAQASSDEDAAADPAPTAPAPDAQPTSLSMYGLSDEQTQQLEQAIAGAALAAQAQAEAEAALEEEEEDDFEDDAEYDEDDGEEMESVPIPGVGGSA
ncbi:hypothetical protein BDZ89DRAFT_1069485 [Hymenopellis radicata]|nr:hypothetical protein BDZ89DRAFT_1069485 [Hymenopellis radicata]